MSAWGISLFGAFEGRKAFPIFRGQSRRAAAKTRTYSFALRQLIKNEWSCLKVRTANDLY